MTGDQHYKEAERLIGLAAENADWKEAAEQQQLAQVHATLALSAATLDAACIHADESSAVLWHRDRNHLGYGR